MSSAAVHYDDLVGRIADSFAVGYEQTFSYREGEWHAFDGETDQPCGTAMVLEQLTGHVERLIEAGDIQFWNPNVGALARDALAVLPHCDLMVQQ